MNIRKIKIILQLIIFFIATTYIYLNINFFELINLIEYKISSILIIILFLLISFMMNILQTKRWQILIEHFGEKTNFFTYFKFITYSNLLTEVSFIGIFSRMMIRLYSQINAINVMITLFIEKILSAYSIFILCCPGLFLFITRESSQLNIISKSAIFLFIILMIIFPFFLIKLKNLKIFNFIKNLNKVKKLFYILNHKLFILLLINTLILQILGIFNTCIVIKIYNFDVNFLTIILIMPIITFLIAIPASITPWGWRELIFINIFPLVGLSKEQSLLISLTNGVLLLVTQFIFYLFVITFSKKMLNQ